MHLKNNILTNYLEFKSEVKLTVLTQKSLQKSFTWYKVLIPQKYCDVITNTTVNKLCVKLKSCINSSNSKSLYVWSIL